MKPDKPLSKFEFWLYKNAVIVHGFRISIAFILTFLFIRELHIPEASWPLITIIVVMGPISTWGNVLPRARERMIGTVLGMIAGLIALEIECYSLIAMLLWCGIVMIYAGIKTLGNHPYIALMTAITLGVVIGTPAGDLNMALWRSGDVLLGCVLALVFTGIFAQRAYLFWRIRLAKILLETYKIYHSGLSANLLDKPQLNKSINQLLVMVVKLRSTLEPAHKETRIPPALFEKAQTIQRNLISIIEMQINASWDSRASHLLLLNAATLRRNQRFIESTLIGLSEALISGKMPDPIYTSSARTELVAELQTLLTNTEYVNAEATLVYGYVWLSLEMNRQLQTMSNTLRLVLQHR